MQGFPKKRRKPGPSKNEEKIRRNENEARLSSIPLSANYPRLESLAGELTFNYPPGNVLDSVKIQASRSQPVTLSFDCPGRCGRGKFHLGPKLAEAMTQNRERLDVAIPCPERSMGTDACGCELRGVLQLRFVPEPAQ
jgi:hypothetical protein